MPWRQCHSGGRKRNGGQRDLSEIFDYLGVNNLAELLLRIVAVFVCITIYQASVSYFTYKLGDNTARDGHRISLNPFRHLDPLGLLLLVVVGFGWAKPVPVDHIHFKNPKRDMVITSLVGPLSCFAMAVISVIFYHIAFAIESVTGYFVILYWMAFFFIVLASTSIGICVFNLLPFPPLAGFKILSAILPEKLYFAIMRYERYGMIVLLVLVCFTPVGRYLGTAIGYLLDFIVNATKFI